MTFELTALTLAALLQVIQFVLMAVPANIEAGPGKTMGTRDGLNVDDHISARTGRLMRATDNHYEALILFGIACTVITVSGQSTGLTAACATIYLIARVLYIPAYAFGWVPWRSYIWFAGFLATVLMLIAALIS